MTKIEWTDEVWNPTSGCDRVSSGCDHCYAMTMAKRLKAMGAPGYQRDGDLRTSGPGFGVTLHPDRLDVPLRWRKPRKVFVNSMSDLFHDDVPVKFIAQVFAVMAAAPRHTFQVLTKRHSRMRSLLRSENFAAEVNRQYCCLPSDVPSIRGYQWPLPTVWLGVSVEDQQWADIRIPALLDTPAAVRFISAEPLLGPVDLSAWLPRAGCVMWDGKPTSKDQAALAQVIAAVGRMHGLGWVIVGGESGPGARPMHPQWARDLRDQCVAADVPFFMKQTGVVLAREWGLSGTGHDATAWPEPFPQEYPEAVHA